MKRSISIGRAEQDKRNQSTFLDLIILLTNQGRTARESGPICF